MRVIILCAGDGERWGNYLGIPKHLVTVDGKKLINRTVEQFQGEDIYIVSNSTNYEIAETNLYIPTRDENNAGADKLLSSSCLWSDYDRTLLLFGDVYFTDEAMQIIKGYTKRDWAVFGRFEASELTGCQWGEIFAFSFYPENIKELNNAIDKAIWHYNNGEVNRCQGWQIYRVWAGMDIGVHQKDEHFIEIDDFTDDFDYPNDYDLWMHNYAKAKELSEMK